jgi:hypothetical protein
MYSHKRNPKDISGCSYIYEGKRISSESKMIKFKRVFERQTFRSRILKQNLGRLNVRKFSEGSANATRTHPEQGILRSLVVTTRTA